MISENILSNYNCKLPTNWYISTPNLYGGNYFWDIVGGQAASFYRNPDGCNWKSFSDKPGTFGGCITTSNTTDSCYINLNLTYNKPFTVMCWAKISNNGTNSYLIDTSIASIRLPTSPDGVIRINTGTVGTLPYPSNVWTHFAMTVGFSAGDIQKGYINGKLGCTFSSSSSVSSCIIKAIGNQGGSETSTKQVKGDFDDIMVFDGILSEETIRGIYNSSFIRKLKPSRSFSYKSYTSPVEESTAMSWDTEVIETVRYLIGDVDATQKYTDARIQTDATISANFIARDVGLTGTYSINITDKTITPDPSSTDPVDYGFLDMISIRAAILILQGEAKIYASSSMRVMDGPSSIDVAGIFLNTKKIMDDLNLTYAMAKNRYVMSNSGYGKSILSTTIDKNLLLGGYYDGCR